MTTEKTFVLRWLDALRDAPVSINAVAVGAIAATFADYGTGRAMRAGHVRLADGARTSIDTVRRAVRELVGAGLMEWDGAATWPGRARSYNLVIPATGGTGAMRTGSTRAGRSGSTGSTRAGRTGSRQASERVAPVHTHQYQDHAPARDGAGAPSACAHGRPNGDKFTTDGTSVGGCWQCESGAAS